MYWCKKASQHCWQSSRKDSERSLVTAAAKATWMMMLALTRVLCLSPKAVVSTLLECRPPHNIGCLSKATGDLGSMLAQKAGVLQEDVSHRGH